MPISERATRGLSLWLVAAVAATTIGWTAAGQAGSPCSPQDHSCTPKASQTCCCHSSPDLPDAAWLPVVAPPSGAPSRASLMDDEPPALRPSSFATKSRDPQRHIDLRLRYQRLLI
jgi:hypothetical protein